MELHDALTQIAEIRRQLARTEVFRGYRAMPVAFSGILALSTAAFQQVWLPDPVANLPSYLTLWISAAFVSALAAGTEMLLRCWRSPTTLTREITWLAVEQFLPCLLAGALLTAVLVAYVPESVWMLPGLWQMLFGLGIFASHRLLPRATLGVAVFYLLSGALVLAQTRGPAGLSPWAMGVPFGVGQLYAAAVLYWTLERNHGEQ
jgi:hypothetical protein